MRAWVTHSPGTGRDVRFCLVFPREALSIPVMRHVLGDTLSRLGVADDSVSDLLLAATEACTNVLRHAGPGRRYEVVAKVGRHHCLLQVLDNGRGFDPGQLRRRPEFRRPPVRPGALLRRREPRGELPPGEMQQLAESGRGLTIMQACVDDVRLRSGHGRGTAVSLRRRIEWRADAPLRQLPAEELRDAS